jgi:hypothetical protein
VAAHVQVCCLAGAAKQLVLPVARGDVTCRIRKKLYWARYCMLISGGLHFL